MKTCNLVDFVVPAKHKVKIEESEKEDKYLDITRELKQMCKIRVSVKPIQKKVVS